MKRVVMLEMGSVGFFILLMGLVFVCPLCEAAEIIHGVDALLAFKQSIVDDPLSRLSNWNNLDGDPCHWYGILCEPTTGNVVSLNLSGCSLRGFLSPELGLLRTLDTLILSGNSFMGTIPKEIGQLTQLKVLDLSYGHFSGPVPKELGNLGNVTRIYLQYNELTGSLPEELGSLRNLVELKLNNNKLQGSLPSIFGVMTGAANLQGLSSTQSSLPCLFPQLRVADFSNNFFTGRIPSCLKRLPRSSFQLNCFIDRTSFIQRAPQDCGATKYTKGHQEAKASCKKDHSTCENDVAAQPRFPKPVWLLTLEITVGVIMGILIFSAIGAACAIVKKRKKMQMQMQMLPYNKASSCLKSRSFRADLILVKGVSTISRVELEFACEEFSNIIGSSSNSVVFKGTMKGGPEIAVVSLCISEDCWTNSLDVYFQKEVADLARLNHENTAKLISYCCENEPFSRMLVFEYASNGTLYEHLHYGEECQLTWVRRMKIILGVAYGLRYVHTELQPPFTVTELNSSTVYLTEDFSPKLADFGSWKSVFSRSAKSSGLTRYNGHSLALERLSDVKGNVFAFGVLMLEIISGRPPYSKDQGHLVDWARYHLKQPDEMVYLVDSQLSRFRHEDLRAICEVVDLCIEVEPSKRPNMAAVCAMLENGINMSPIANIKESSLAWAELALAS